jgi:hypothetical protein
MFYSKACEKVKKRNSYTVMYTSNTSDGRVGEISYFLKVKDQVENVCHFLAAMYEMKSFPDEAIMANAVVSIINKDLFFVSFFFSPYVQILIITKQLSSNDIGLGTY